MQHEVCLNKDFQYHLKFVMCYNFIKTVFNFENSFIDRVAIYSLTFSDDSLCFAIPNVMTV